MKRKLLLSAVLITVALFASCRKEDAELLKHPYRVQGTVDPGLSLPVISAGEMNLNELLTTFDGTFSGFLLDDDLITFHFDTSLVDSLGIGEGTPSETKGRTPRLNPASFKDGSDNLIHLVDTTIRYEIPIDLFNKTQDIDAQIAHLLLKLNVFVNGGCPDEATEQFLRQNASISLNKLKVQYLPQTGNDTIDFDGNDALSDSIFINDLVTGGSVSFEDVNLASIINDKPRLIVASFHMNFNVSTHVRDSLIANIDPINHPEDLEKLEEFTSMLDAMQMSWLKYKADLSVDFPFEIHIGGMTYQYSIEVGQTVSSANSESSLDEVVDKIKDNLKKSGIDLIFDSLNRFIFEFENEMPIEFLLNGTFLDANGQSLGTLFSNGIVAAAATAPVEGNPGVSRSTAPTISRISVPLDMDNLENVLNAKELRFDLGLSTNGTDKMMILRSDRLKVRMMLQLHPALSVDMALFGSNNNQ